MAIIAVLIGLLLPAIQKVREASSKTQCANNLKQIALAIQNYHDQYQAIPYSRSDPGDTWAVLILPFLEQNQIYSQWNRNNLSYYGQTAAVRMAPVKTYFCPTRRTPPGTPSASTADDDNNGAGPHSPGSLSDYACNAGDPNTRLDYNSANVTGTEIPANGPFWRKGVPLNFSHIKDGLSNTFFVGE